MEKCVLDELTIDELNKKFNDVKEYLKIKPITFYKGSKTKNPLFLEVNKHTRFIKFSLQAKTVFHLDTIVIKDSEGNQIGTDGQTTISSSYQDNDNYNGSAFMRRKGNGGCGFHTKNETNPWFIIDLKKSTDVGTIVVNNRDDNFYARALSLQIETSGDLTEWTLEYDNYSVLKEYKNGDVDLIEHAFLYAAALESVNINKIIKKLKELSRDDIALRCFELTNTLIEDKGLALGPHGGFTETFSLSSFSNKQKVYSELSTLLTWLNEELHIAAFISSGTLLGIVRDGDFIGHDDDVDICYISNEISESDILLERKKITTILEQKGCKVRNSNVAHLWCETPKGVHIDIFTGFQESGNCSMNPISRNEIKTNSVLPVQKKVVNDHVLYLPFEPNALLSKNYGESWMKPDPIWTFNWTKAGKDFSFLYF